MERVSKLFTGVLIALLTVGPHGVRADDVFPGAQWEFRTPEEAGMDADKLQEFSNYTGGRGCVTRYGYMVHTWGSQSQRSDVASACKPWYAHFLFRAVEDGLLPGIGDLVVDFEPGLWDLNPDLGYKDRDITWRHMSNQISCYGVVEPPGEAFDYSDYQIALFFDTLILNVYGSTWATMDDDVLHPMLTDHLQCQDNPTFLAFGTGDRPGRVGISVRDFCRFGLLYLHQGNWDGTPLISQQHALTAVTSPLSNDIPHTSGQSAEMIPGQRSLGGGNNQCDHSGSYSFLWWTNGVDRNGLRHWPDVPEDAYGAFGHGGPRAMVVIPSLDIVLSWNDANIHGADDENTALGLLVESVVSSPGPQPGQIMVDPEHPAWFKYHEGGPFYMCGPGDPEGFLYRGARNPDGTRDGDQVDLINTMQNTGANCIYLMAARSHGGDGGSTENPFVDSDPANPLDDDILDQWETWFTTMDDNGIVIYFFFYDDAGCINHPLWDTGDEIGEAEQNFIDTIVNRFKHHKLLIWCVKEEYAEGLSHTRAERIAERIRMMDEYEHPVAIHQNNSTAFDFNGSPHFHQFAVQYNVGTAEQLHAGTIAAWNNVGGLVNVNISEFSNAGSGQTLRKKIWAIALGGGYSMILGMDIASTPPSDLETCGRLVRFMEATRFHKTSPHDELARGDTDYVLAAPGEVYIAYADAGDNLGLSVLAETYAVRWYDPVTGDWYDDGTQTLEAGDQTFTKPAGIGDEAALYLVTPGGPDETPPTAPTGLEATPISDTQIDLTWEEADDPESGISEYKVYRDGECVGTVPGTQTCCSDVGLEELTEYTYQVTAVNGVGLEGAPSDPVSATTLADTTAPTIVSVTAAGNQHCVIVAFSEPVEEMSAETVANYAIDHDVAVTDAALQPDTVTVNLTTSILSTGIVYTLTVNNVEDRSAAGNPIAPDSQAQFVYMPRVTDGLVVLYDFEEGEGTMVHDVSGVGEPLDLTLADPGAAEWVEGGLSITSSTIVQSAAAATKIIDACMASNEITIEAWIVPANTTQSGPARIVTLSASPSVRNFTLGQSSTAYDVRLRTTETSNNGIPSLPSPAGAATTELTHFVYTRAETGQRTIYVDNVEQASGSIGGDFSNWDTGYRFALANELTLDRTWLGEFRLVAIYDRALEPAEVTQNFDAGPDGPGLPGDLDDDGDVDIDDFNTFADCLAGPDVFDPPPDCNPGDFINADLDGDGDVDLADFARFQEVFTGP